MYILPVGAELFLRTGRERERGMKKLIVVLRHFMNKPKNSLNYEMTQIFTAFSVCRS